MQHERQQTILPDIPAYEISSGTETKKLVLDTLAEFYNLGKIHTSHYIRMDPKAWRDDLFNKDISYLTATFIFGDASSRMDGVGSYYRVSNVSEYALSFTRQKDVLCITTKKL
ncbi:hypothetical protein DC3_52520 [Deinococcus cellulosilyticus NBRC 106333 = KACC 11606]|uniref:Uncharacterized protein n=2 Tax=Deinococcus cellulosilyticus TaxID=401558 RepID=A0A511NAL6_DEIC1|nr:hypothetical protein DC3_52520 [Deinococcus cellulosilyticus NBRC 106333 = KACC 11606]